MSKFLRCDNCDDSYFWTETHKCKMTNKFEQKIEEAAKEAHPDLLGIGQGSYRASFESGARFAHQIIMDDVAKLVEALEMTAKHYAHPSHDHNWAYYIHEQHLEALKNWRDKNVTCNRQSLRRE